MSCYFRHIKGVLDEAGIEVTPDSKKKIDQAIHQIAGIPYKNCSGAWKELKQQISSDKQGRKELVTKLKQSIL